MHLNFYDKWRRDEVRHFFFTRGKCLWTCFSLVDSASLDSLYSRFAKKVKLVRLIINCSPRSASHHHHSTSPLSRRATSQRGLLSPEPRPRPSTRDPGSAAPPSLSVRPGRVGGVRPTTAAARCRPPGSRDPDPAVQAARPRESRGPWLRSPREPLPPHAETCRTAWRAFPRRARCRVDDKRVFVVLFRAADADALAPCRLGTQRIASWRARREREEPTSARPPNPRLVADRCPRE